MDYLSENNDELMNRLEKIPGTNLISTEILWKNATNENISVP